MSGSEGPADEIRRLYFAATKATIARDLDRAIDLLISLESDDARERVAVFVDGLAQMRKEWGGATATHPPAGTTGSPPAPASRSARLPRPPGRRR